MNSNQTHAVEIRSVRDGATLELSHFKGAGDAPNAETFLVVARRTDLHAVTEVSAFMAPDLGGYFQELTRMPAGWKGPMTWSTLEGEFWLTTTMDSTGHVSIEYYLRNSRSGIPWELKGTLELELGQLPALARDITEAWKPML